MTDDYTPPEHASLDELRAWLRDVDDDALAAEIARTGVDPIARLQDLVHAPLQLKAYDAEPTSPLVGWLPLSPHTVLAFGGVDVADDQVIVEASPALDGSVRQVRVSWSVYDDDRVQADLVVVTDDGRRWPLASDSRGLHSTDVPVACRVSADGGLALRDLTVEAVPRPSTIDFDIIDLVVDVWATAAGALLVNRGSPGATMHVRLDPTQAHELGVQEVVDVHVAGREVLIGFRADANAPPERVDLRVPPSAWTAVLLQPGLNTVRLPLPPRGEPLRIHLRKSKP